MKVIVQKFGGTSLRDDFGRKKATQHIVKAKEKGYKVVVVVSAMGRKGDPYATDSLLDLVSHIEPVPNREQDLLLSCGEIISAVVMLQLVKAAQLQAIVLTGAQAGIYTTSQHGNARITKMDCERILKEMEYHDVIIVPGFQGVSEKGEITTLGRGGSDTSAAALGTALQAHFIDIFTDVEGIMTADPRIVKGARALGSITYVELSNLAYQGAKVIHPRAVEIAKAAKIPIRIRSTFSEKIGTLVSGQENKTVQERIITGITYVENVTQIKVNEDNGNSYGNLPSNVFKAMAEQAISVDFINIYPNGAIFTVADEVTDLAVNEIEKLGYAPQIVRQCAKVSAVGAGMTGIPGVTAKIVDILTNNGIQILQSADSHTTIWMLIKQRDLSLAINALHDGFCLH